MTLSEMLAPSSLPSMALSTPPFKLSSLDPTENAASAGMLAIASVVMVGEGISRLAK